MGFSRRSLRAVGFFLFCWFGRWKSQHKVREKYISSNISHKKHVVSSAEEERIRQSLKTVCSGEERGDRNVSDRRGVEYCFPVQGFFFLDVMLLWRDGEILGDRVLFSSCACCQVVLVVKLCLFSSCACCQLIPIFNFRDEVFKLH